MDKPTVIDRLFAEPADRWLKDSYDKELDLDILGPTKKSLELMAARVLSCNENPSNRHRTHPEELQYNQETLSATGICFGPRNIPHGAY